MGDMEKELFKDWQIIKWKKKMITIYKTGSLSTQYCIKTHSYMGATGHRVGGGGGAAGSLSLAECLDQE